MLEKLLAMRRALLVAGSTRFGSHRAAERPAKLVGEAEKVLSNLSAIPT
jgi:hypothetical protein